VGVVQVAAILLPQLFFKNHGRSSLSDAALFHAGLRWVCLRTSIPPRFPTNLCWLIGLGRGGGPSAFRLVCFVRGNAWRL